MVAITRTHCNKSMCSYLHTLLSLKLITSAANAHRNSGKSCGEPFGNSCCIHSVVFLMKALICEANELVRHYFLSASAFVSALSLLSYQ